MTPEFHVDKRGHIHISGHEIKPDDPCDGVDCLAPVAYIGTFRIMTGSGDYVQGALRLCVECADIMAMDEPGVNLVSIGDARALAVPTDNSQLGQRPGSQKLINNLANAMAFITERREITSKQLAARFQLHDATALGWLNRLMQDGRVVRRVAGQNRCFYSVKKVKTSTTNGKWILKHGCWRLNDIASREHAETERFDTRDQAIEALDNHEIRYRSLGYSVWFSKIEFVKGDELHEN